MSVLETAGLAVLRRIDPERAHGLALMALKSGLLPLPGPVSTPRLVTEIAGLKLQNPVGLAAGFDKNVTAISPLSRSGFGFIEVGAVTPQPQPGNPKPRLFRLTADRAAINRFGFNNDGMQTIALRLAARGTSVPIGLNLGANKDSRDRAGDFSAVLRTCGEVVDFATVNVSSPNTEKLRDLQGKSALTALLSDVIRTRDTLGAPIPIFLKISPDLATTELEDIAEVAGSTRIAGIIATNTTVSRDGLRSRHAGQKGGLSGAPLFNKSTRVLAALAEMTDGRIPLIGVGGISSGQQAYDKIKAGASAVQLYTAMVFQGLSLAAKIAKDLDALAAADGFAHISEAVGTEKGKWLCK